MKKKNRNKSFVSKRKKGLKIKSKAGINKSIRLKSSNNTTMIKKFKESSRKGGDSTRIGKQNSRRNFSMDYDDVTKYKPLCTALPSNMPVPPSIADRIRAAKRLHMTRRDMTEQKIIKNIVMHNDPADVQNFEVLYISNKNDPFVPESYRGNISRGEFPPLV